MQEQHNWSYAILAVESSDNMQHGAMSCNHCFMLVSVEAAWNMWYAVSHACSRQQAADISIASVWAVSTLISITWCSYDALSISV